MGVYYSQGKHLGKPKGKRGKTTMMNIIDMMRELEKCGDINLDTFHRNGDLVYSVVIRDFDGFDENWNEIDRTLNNPDLLEKFINTIEENALAIENDYYADYYFDDYVIHLGYESMDI